MKRREFLLAAAGLAACKRPELKNLRIYPALALLALPDAKWIGGIKVESIRDTAIYQRMLAEKKLSETLDRFASRTGLDPRKDLYELMFCSDGKHSVVMAWGKFIKGGSMGSSGVEPDIKIEGLPVERIPYKGYTLIGSDQAALVFINNAIAIAGTGPSVRAVIDAKNATNRPQELLDRAAQLPPGTQMWAVSKGLDTLLPAVPLGGMGQLKEVPVKVDAVTAAADLRQGVKVHVQSFCRDPKSAEQLRNAMKAVIGFGRLQTPDDKPEMLRFFDGIAIEQKDALIDIRLDLPEDLLEQFLKLLETRRVG